MISRSSCDYTPGGLRRGLDADRAWLRLSFAYSQAAATLQDASGCNFFQYFSTSTGAPVGQPTQLPWPTSEQAIAAVAYGANRGPRSS